MTHSMSFDFPNPQVALLRDILAEQVSAAKENGQPAPTWDGFRAELLTELLSNWLAWASTLKAFPTPYPALLPIKGSQSLAETISLADAGEAAAQAYFAQYSASPAAQAPQPLALDQLLSAQLQRVLMEYVALAATRKLPEPRIFSIPPPPAFTASPAHPAPCSPGIAVPPAGVPPPVFDVPPHFLR